MIYLIAENAAVFTVYILYNVVIMITGDSLLMNEWICFLKKMLLTGVLQNGCKFGKYMTYQIMLNSELNLNYLAFKSFGYCSIIIIIIT